MIQPADKGSGLCILDRTGYIEEAQRQLNATLTTENSEVKYYETIEKDVIEKQYSDVKKVFMETILGSVSYYYLCDQESLLSKYIAVTTIVIFQC